MSKYAIFDIIFIIAQGIVIGMQSLACQPDNPNIRHATYPFLNVGLTGSIYMTVAISLERYLCMHRQRLENNERHGFMLYLL